MSDVWSFENFKEQTKADWLAKAEKDLKGKPIESLISDWYGLKIDPYFTQENINSTSAKTPLVRENHGWVNYVSINVQIEKQANKIALETLMLGATGINFILNSPPDFAVLLKDIELQHCSIAFSGLTQDLELANFIKTHKHSEHFAGFIDRPYPVSEEFSSSFWPTVVHGNSNDELYELKEILDEVYRLLIPVENNKANSVICNIAYRVHMSTNYFFGIAKIRALRILLSRFYSAYQQNLTPDIFHIIAYSPPWTNDDYEPHENMLKATTSAMAAIIGGCNSLIIEPGYKDEQEELVARNISSILQFETYLNKTADPAAGSFFLEQLTEDIVKSVWLDFKSSIVQ